MYFHKKGKRDFMNSKTGGNCALLFTDPLEQETDEGELAILGMPFFRQYEVAFDFCSREMYTSWSNGDCSHHIGTHPKNVDYCGDKDWISCWLSGIWGFFEEFFEGILALFGNGDSS